MIESASSSVFAITGDGRGIGNGFFPGRLRREARVVGPIQKPTGRSANAVKASPKALASLAVKSLLEEAELTPKPALVDRRGPGAWANLSLRVMRCSAQHLAPFFELMALTSLEQIPTQTLREELGIIGRWAEQSMLACTDHVNTHRGAIWSLGLLVSAAAMGAASPEAIAETARQLACLPDPNAPKAQSQSDQHYRVPGARGEAQAGFPSIMVAGLPRLRLSRQIDESETLARLNALLAIMAGLDDSCLVRQGGLTALTAAQIGASSILDAGGAATPEGWRLLQQLDRSLLILKSSPRGSADMLSATLFLDYLSGDEGVTYRGHFGRSGSKEPSRAMGRTIFIL